MAVAADGFDWDAGNRDKCQKHGVSLAEIEAFLLKNPRVAPDLRHSGNEGRQMAVGRDSQGRALFVVFTIRIRDGLRLIRPLSARYMHRKEIEGYETENS
jgi:Uncharacterized protein conserved in bacteria